MIEITKDAAPWVWPVEMANTQHSPSFSGSRRFINWPDRYPGTPWYPHIDDGDELKSIHPFLLHPEVLALFVWREVAGAESARKPLRDELEKTSNHAHWISIVGENTLPCHAITKPQNQLN